MLPQQSVSSKRNHQVTSGESHLMIPLGHRVKIYRGGTRGKSCPHFFNAHARPSGKCHAHFLTGKNREMQNFGSKTAILSPVTD
jgi:hypothetical protein